LLPELRWSNKSYAHGAMATMRGVRRRQRPQLQLHLHQLGFKLILLLLHTGFETYAAETDVYHPYECMTCLLVFSIHMFVGSLIQKHPKLMLVFSFAFPVLGDIVDALQKLWGVWNLSTPDLESNLAGWSSSQQNPCSSELGYWQGVTCLRPFCETWCNESLYQVKVISL
jgi:hypothetical protein